MLIIILIYEIMIFIGCASPAGPSYCFLSVDALGLLVVAVVEFDLNLLNKDHCWQIAIGIID